MRANPMTFWLILLLTACMTGTGSSEPPEETPPMPLSLGEPLTLELGEVARMDDPEPMTIRFIDVPTDSRCPEGVTCVWEGDAEAVFEVTLGDESAEVGLHTHGGDQYPSRRSFAGYTLRLETLEPYPREGRPIAREDYQVTVELLEYQPDPRPGTVDAIQSTKG